MTNWSEDKLSIHREDDGEEYLIVHLSEKWWNFIQEVHMVAIPIKKIEEARRERRNVDALLASIE